MHELYLGLISGTSMDAVDTALVDLSEPDIPRIVATCDQPYPPSIRENIVRILSDPDQIGLATFGEIDGQIGAVFADAANALIRGREIASDQIRAVGSHGQNVHHAPNASPPFSLQLGDPSIIAERTGITTVADFRRRDMAAGGQGAPLAPALHQALFSTADETRCVLNLGGIANITLLPADPNQPVSGFDTGPANALMDAWAHWHLDAAFDRDGAWARSDEVDDALLQRLMRDPYFRKSPPKSTGKEYFNLAWLRDHLESLPHTPEPAAVQRTLCELTVRTVAQAILGLKHHTDRILICGGGAHNALLREGLEEALHPKPVEETGAYGIDVDHVESCAFAWLAMRTMKGLAGNLPSVTGARREVVLGGIYPASR